jgi:hypothetical protein
MMISYGESGRNSKAAARLYREHFPHRRHPSSDVFLGLVNTTRTIGFLVPDRKRVAGVDRTVRTPDTEEVVLQSFTEDNVRSIKNKIEPPGLCYSDTFIGSNHHFRLL